MAEPRRDLAGLDAAAFTAWLRAEAAAHEAALQAIDVGAGI